MKKNAPKQNAEIAKRNLKKNTLNVRTNLFI